MNPIPTDPQYRINRRVVSTPSFRGGAVRISQEEVEELVPVMPMTDYPMDDMDYAPASIEDEEYVYQDSMEPEEEMIDDPSLEYDESYL